MKFNIPLVIFAGGKSSRMGRDKALLTFGNYNTLSQYQHVRLSKLFNNIYISSKEHKFDFNINVILDKYSDASPLIGIISILETLDTDKVFILSVDAPFVAQDVIEKLMHYPKNFDVLIAKSPSGIQPLCGIYHRSILKVAKENLKENNHKLKYLLSKVDTHSILFEDDTLFMNLNHPHEYEEAVEKLKN